jgi:hypothetical protein
MTDIMIMTETDEIESYCCYDCCKYTNQTPQEREQYDPLCKTCFEKVDDSEEDDEEDSLTEATKERNERLNPKGLEAGFCKKCDSYIEIQLGSEEWTCGDCEEEMEDYYCDVMNHENEKLYKDKDDGWCCALCIEEDCESWCRPCVECFEAFTPSKEHEKDLVCDECVSEKGKEQQLITWTIQP